MLTGADDIIRESITLLDERDGNVVFGGDFGEGISCGDRVINLFRRGDWRKQDRHVDGTEHRLGIGYAVAGGVSGNEFAQRIAPFEPFILGLERQRCGQFTVGLLTGIESGVGDIGCRRWL